MEDQVETQVETLQTVFTDLWNDLIGAIPGLLLALVIFIIGLFVARWLAKIAGRKILSQMDDPLMGRFLTNTLRILLILGVVLLALRAMGLGGIAAGIFGAAGVGAVVLGFAFQDIGENFIAGIVLAFNRPFDVDDTIRLDDHFGRVRGLNLRYTHLKTFDGKDIYIPNADVLKKPLQNYTADGFIRTDFGVGIDYGDDIEGAKEVIQEVLDGHDRLVHDGEHENFVVEDELAVSTVNLKVFFWLYTKDYRANALQSRGLVMRDVKNAIDRTGYSMPADITEVKLYGGEKDIPIRVEFDNTPNSEAENL
ncbi:mechanosensitive ion channel family protein [Neolewinella antarctica]|uniref:Small-conductance mechanosensitive channel n=1 Tax=Neolewinella antarctica TaxID=442734 RepID=A0ABX0XDL0_9BACT|nr:mechanosensitive ion channel domain-containing protein [Neolewinella antarctica]NJC26998.1 small-conductance mechanosensitive channel [Neolewinella antarctica]